MKASRYLKIASFFIVLGTAGTGYIIMSSSGFSRFNTKEYELIIHDATGLSSRSRVYMAGVPVGKVEEIYLEDGRARIKIAVLRDMEIRRGSRISRRSSSLLGTAMLYLEPGPVSEALLPAGSVIGADNEDPSLMETASDILRELQSNQMALLTISLETFNSIAKKIDQRLEEEQDRILRILESAALITERVDRLLASREEDISMSLMDIRLAMANIRQISDEVAQGRGNLGQVIYDDRIYNSLLSTIEETEKAVVKLQGVLDGAGEFVNRASGIGIMVDSRASYGFNSSNVRAGASLRLEPASGDRWYRVGINGAPDGVNSRLVTTTSSGGITTTEDKTETRYSFSVDAELARRFGIVTIRGGLLESSAGIGVDIQPLRQLAVSAEVFKFRTGAPPNLRGTVTVYPFFNPDANNPLNWIYLQGGIYDALHADRDLFLGGGLRFSDRDIRGMVGLAASAAAAR
ncbi:MAG: MlaD family protein [Spirochaetaceae bacterium]|jgi:phospholipid/cholesterol/gamma-HCH transport system substrate-binding protein|nr:MlaD family protein [Spirochaetaceae bacterium]